MKSKTKTPAKKNPESAPHDTEEMKKHITSLALGAAANSAVVMESYARKSWGESFSLPLAIAELEKSNQQLAKGDLSQVENMLFDQAHALQSVFMSLMRTAANQDQLKQYQTHLSLGLKAQAQCRATLETLAGIKNPQPTAFIRQQNIAANQQVNNGNFQASTRAPAPMRADNFANQSNKLLAVKHEQEQRLDFGAAATAGRADQELEAVAASDRPENHAGQSHRQP